MADAAHDLAEHPGVLTFADAVLVSQASEIDLMIKMLAKRDE
jgi:uncharacterized protein (DUF305 family)